MFSDDTTTCPRDGMTLKRGSATIAKELAALVSKGMDSRAQIEVPSDKIDEFCRCNEIKELSLFGSVLREDFRPDSDVDVLVEYEPHASHSLFDLVRMEEELGALLGRKVDLVEKPGLRNPFRRCEILRTRQVIFAA